jgi:hypothetical protein
MIRVQKHFVSCTRPLGGGRGERITFQKMTMARAWMLLLALVALTAFAAADPREVENAECVPLPPPSAASVAAL